MLRLTSADRIDEEGVLVSTGRVMDTALVNTAVAFVSAVLGAWFGHRLSVSEERRRHRFVCLMDLDRIFADSAQHLSGGQLANASRLKADMITLAVQTENPAIWGPVLAFTN